MIDLESYVQRQMHWQQQEITYARLWTVTVRKISNSSGQLIRDYVEINAYNQYLFLEQSSQLPEGMIITSDTEVVRIRPDLAGNIHCFSGKVHIQLPATFSGTRCPVTFYQVLTRDSTIKTA